MRALLLAVASLLVAGCDQDSLIQPDQIVGDTIPQSLTSTPGNPEAGRAVFVEREAGHCVLCHVVQGLEVPFQGDLGPALTDVGARLTPEQIRLRVVDASILNPDSVMPPYYRIHRLHQVADGLAGQPVLSSEQVEDLVAYLAGLKG
ncbi:MAG: sulfur oxidation c-type cytochrome SoxX [Alphaproteobacteria bacterium]